MSTPLAWLMAGPVPQVSPALPDPIPCQTPDMTRPCPQTTPLTHFTAGSSSYDDSQHTPTALAERAACLCTPDACAMGGCPVCAGHVTWVECPTSDGQGI